ncbi:MAG: DUF2203 domain-containing protein [Acidobacteriota bacterium]
MRYFRLTEAERLLPEVERHLRDALFHKSEYERVHQVIEATLDRVRMSGGARIDPGKQLELRTQRDTNVKSLQEAMAQIEQLGALVKDLDIGLLDFMARYNGQDVCLCWKLGEGGIEYWHGVEEGFRGRKAIDQEFRENHSGEALGDTPN